MQAMKNSQEQIELEIIAGSCEDFILSPVGRSTRIKRLQALQDYLDNLTDDI